MSPNLHGWLENQGRTYFPKTSIISGWKHGYRLNFSVDFNKFEVEKLEQSEMNYVAMMADLENNVSFKKLFDLDFQGQSSRLGNRA